MELRVWECNEDGGVDVFGTLQKAGYKCSHPFPGHVLVFMPLGDMWSMLHKRVTGFGFRLSLPNRPGEIRRVSYLIDPPHVFAEYRTHIITVYITNRDRTSRVISMLLPESYTRQQRLLQQIQTQTVCLIYCLSCKMGHLNKDTVYMIAKMYFKTSQTAARNTYHIF